MKTILSSTILFFAICCQVYAQNTVGLISYDVTKAFEGYNLIYPHNQPNVYLLNNCGEIVHTWEDEANFRPGNTAYLSSSMGPLYKSKRDVTVINDPIWAGGGGAILELRTWDNNLVWSFEMNDENNRLHHDFAVTQTGTIIAMAWERKDLAECIAAGKDTSTLASNEIWSDWIFEIDPVTNNILWEWHAWDHLVQDFDDQKDNYGVIADQPNRININYYRPDGHPDWMHSNSLDYNPMLNQILISVPYFNEIWIIDHSTSTEQATSSFGGLGERGGDLLFRWGNPLAYNAADTADQKLFFQHDANWVDDFLELGHPEFGKIAVFNNRAGADFSTVNIIDPAWDMYSWSYSVDNNNVYLPNDFDLSLTHPTPSKLYSTGLSSIQILPNGNRLITSGRFGYSFEMTPNDEIVWEYITPINGNTPATQGDILDINDNLTFRLNRYPVDFAPFTGRDLSPKGWIELEADSSFCEILTNTIEPMDEAQFKLYPNPSTNYVTIEWNGMKYADISVFDLLGQIKMSFRANGGRKYCDTSQWEDGIYFISILVDDKRYTRKLIIQ